MPDQPAEVLPGVTREVGTSRVIYIGSAAALIAAGIIQAHMLPGLAGAGAGAGRTSCSFGSDGARRRRGGAYDPANGAGQKSIFARRRGGETVYEVWLRISKGRVRAIADEAAARASAWPFPMVYGRIPGAPALRQQGAAGAPA